MPFFRSLKVQVTIGLTLVLVAIIGMTVWQLQTQQRKVLTRLSLHQAALTADTVESWLYGLMLRHRGEELQDYVDSYAVQHDILDLKIVRMDGMVAVASDPGEIGGQVEGWAPAELVAGSLPAFRREIIRDRPGYTLRRLIRKVDECYRCHHQQEPYRGVLSVTVSNAPFEISIERLDHSLAGAWLLAAGGSSAILFGLLTWRVNRPLDEVLGALRRVRDEGNLDIRLNATRKDEFGTLARGFNDTMDRVKEAQKELEAHHQREMEQSGHLVAVGEMVGVISHELRNPLAGLRSAIQVLVGEAEEQDSNRQVLLQIDAATKRLDTMLGKTLDLLRPSRMMVEFTDLNDVLKQALFFIHRDRKRGVKLEMDLAPDLPEVRIDSEQLQQVFLNLALNAIQVMGEEGTLRITTSLQKGTDPPSLVVTFTDTGPGIPPEHLEHIFEPLFTTRRDGTGLGLSTSRRIVERHGGNLSVETKMGHGSTFTIRLPEGIDPGEKFGGGHLTFRWDEDTRATEETS